MDGISIGGGQHSVVSSALQASPFRNFDVPGGDFFFFFWAQFSHKLARLYEYSYLGPVLYLNIHIAHDTKVFVTFSLVPRPLPDFISQPAVEKNYVTDRKWWIRLVQTEFTISGP